MEGHQSYLLLNQNKVKAVILQMVFYLLIFQSGYAQMPGDGLVAYWSFNEGSGTTAQDSAGDNTGTLINGPSWVTGRAGNALSFDGINDYVEITDHPSLDLTAGEFTLSAWIYPESYGEDLNGRIIDHGGGSSGEGGWSLVLNNYQNSQNLRQSIKNGNGGYNIYSDIGSISLNTWQHTAVTLKSGTVTFYINGQTEGQTAGVPSPTDRNGPIRIGMRATDFLRVFAGVIDEVSIYDRALSYQEITDLYNQVPPLSDMKPPVISDGQPVGVLPLDTTTATLSVTSDEDAICKYSTSPGTPYSSMPDTFSNTGGTTHTNLISGLEYVESRTYYIKCRDQSGNSNPSDYTVSFSINRTVYSVSMFGSDSNPGTDAFPMKTIQHAIESASRNNSNETVIKVAQGIYYENISIVCCSSRNNWQILGGWSSDFKVMDRNTYSTVLDAGGKQRAIKINVRELDLTLEGFTIRNGFDSAAGGGIAVFPFYNGSITLNLDNNIITRNRSGSAGGGVYVSSREHATTTLTLTNNVIAHNSADDLCGGVCVISETYANTTVTLTSNTVIDNHAGNEGGGIYLRAYSGAAIISTFTDNAITRNDAAYFGAGLYAMAESNATLTADFIYNRITVNTGPYFGGGLYLHSVTDATLTANFTSNTIAGNSAELHGGGLYEISALNADMTLSFTHNTISGNSALYDGGGVFSLGRTASAFANNIISGNSASRGAGVFVLEGPALSFQNDTIAGNSASFFGGGLYAHSVSDANTTVDIRNTIIWGNDFTDIVSSGGSILTASYSDIGSGSFVNNSTNMNTDPKFIASVYDNYHLSSSSPLINRGDNSGVSWGTDIDGNPRIMYGKVDIGADEHIFSIIKPDPMPSMNTDGDLSEYTGTDSISLTPSSGENTVTVKAIWDNEALYLAYAVSDTQLNASVTVRDGNVGYDDSAGWTIDTLNDAGGSGDQNASYMLPDDFLGIVNIHNVQYDAQGTASGAPTNSWNGTWQSAVKVSGTINNNSDTDNGYTAEVKIPWTTLDYLTAPYGDKAVRMGFFINDKDDSYCDVDPSGTYIDAEYFTGTENEAGNFSELTTLGGYLNAGYLKTLLPEGQNIFTAQTPIGGPNGQDGPVENGVKWTSDVDGYVTGVRYYKHSSNTGTHKGRLWKGSTLLANATFINETLSGWQTIYFDSPVAVTADTTYTVSYHSTAGYYYQNNNYFGTVNNLPLHISSAAGQNGVFRYGTASGFECSQMPCTPALRPDINYNANFWVDVVFVQSLPSCTDIAGREHKKYELDFEAGAYTIWLRGYAVTGADTVLVGVDGSCLGTYQFQSKNQWSWSNTAIAGTNSTGVLSAAPHHIDIWTRQANVLIDGIYVTTEAVTPTDSSHGIEIDPADCDATSNTKWPEGEGTDSENASNWQEMRFTVMTNYYCDYDHDGHMASMPSNACLGTGCQPIYCQTVPGTDCDDNDFYAHFNQTWYKDSDNDYYSDGTTDQTSCTRPAGFKTYLELAATSGDCDDTNELINPQATEIWYDDVDQDCDGCNDYDQDMDGFVHEEWNDKAGGCLPGINDCCSPGIDDCDDRPYGEDGLPQTPDDGANINPDTEWYPDFDNDMYGNPTYAFVQCLQPAGPPVYVMNNLDCDDNDANIHPWGPPVRISSGIPSYYSSIQEAYDAAGTEETIQCQDSEYSEILSFDLDKSVYIEGGYDCAYSIITGTTTVLGDMMITDGSVLIEDFEVQLPLEHMDY